MADVMTQPEVGFDLQKGASLLAACIRPTLGPYPRAVLATALKEGQLPESLDGGGAIARRIIELPSGKGDIGAMLLRQLILGLEDRVGDGTATAAVMYEALLRRCMRLISAGHDTVAVRRVLDRSMSRVDELINRSTVGIANGVMIEAVATAASGDWRLGRTLAAVFEVVGSVGRVELRGGHKPESTTRFVSGSYWDWGLLASSSEALTDRIEGDDACVILTDLELESPQELISLLELVGPISQPVFVTVASISDQCVGILQAQPVRHQVAVVKLPQSDRQSADLSDVALLTGATPLLGVAGRHFSSLQIGDIGRARHVWADRQHFGVVGGDGDRGALREQYVRTRASYFREDDQKRRRHLLRRLGQLSPGSAVVTLGATTERDASIRKRQAQRAIATTRLALDDGVVPGGGSVLVAAAGTLRKDLQGPREATERGVITALAHALEEPLRILAANSGYDPMSAVDELQSADADCVFDVTTGTIRPAVDSGVWDATAVIRSAIRGAIVTASQAISVAAAVHDGRNGRNAIA